MTWTKICGLMPLIAHSLGARILGQGAALINVTAEAVNANTLPYPLSRLLMARPTCYRLRTSEDGAGVMRESCRRANDDEAVSGRRSLSVDPIPATIHGLVLAS